MWLGLESKQKVNLEEIFMSKWDFLIDFLCISFLWKVNRVGGLGKEIASKFGGNIHEQMGFPG